MNANRLVERSWSERVGEWMRGLFSFLGWLYLARVSLVGLLVLFALPLGARGALRTLAIGAFDLHLLWGALGIGFLYPFAAWAVFITAAMVFAYGAKRSRFDVLPPPEWIVSAWRYALGAAVLLNLWTICGATDREDRLRVMVCAVLGLLAGMFVVAVVEELHRRGSNAWLGGNLYLFPIKADSVTLKAVAEKQLSDPDGDRWDWWLRGYRERVDGKWKTVPGQLLLVGGALLFFGLYWIFFLFSKGEVGELTSLVYLLLLFTTAVLVAGWVSFFLDAYRIPFLTVCIVWLVLTSQFQTSDHYYRIWKRDTHAIKVKKVLAPADVLENAVKAERPIVLVAIAGGGIQSSAWGTRVLTGLEELVPDARRHPHLGTDLPDFAGSIQCISGVSGGSTGAMFFVAGYGPNGLPAPRPEKAEDRVVDPAVLDEIVQASEETSLGQSVWGLTYPDLRRAWLPFFIGNDYTDRAETMERKWATNGKKLADRGGADLWKASLYAWQKDVAEGLRPATIFNGTLVETGERICFSTAPLRVLYGGQEEFASRKKSDPQLYPGADLRITTAARLSATFPIISSAARPLLAEGMNKPKGKLMPPESLWPQIPGKDALLHVVDGGYFENTGLGALAQWLDNGLTELSCRPNGKWPHKILILQLEAFPEEDPPPRGDPQTQDASGRGTLFQATSPIVALYNVRGAGHTASATRLIEVLQQRWKLVEEPVQGQPAKPSHSCEIRLVRFTIPKLPRNPAGRRFWEPAWAEAQPDSPPLSWHLRQPEKDAIEVAWQALRAESRTLSEEVKKSAVQNAQYGGESGKQLPVGPSAKKSPEDPGAYPVDRVLEFLKDAQSDIKEAAQAATPSPQR
jgi:hypothetical protein